MRGFKLFNLLLLPALAGYFVYLIDPTQLQARTVFYVFQNRDLARALELLRGHILFYGPEMTGGGNLPGPFYYFILSAFLWIQPVWQSAWWGMVLLAGVGAGVVFYFLRANALLVAALLWLPFFVDSAHTQHLFTIFINPSYLFLFVMLLLVCASLCAGSENEKTRERAFLTASVVTAFAIQVHLSAIFIYFAMIFMQVMGERLKLPRLEKKRFYLGLALFALPLLPYIIWNILQRFGHEMGEPGAYTGQFESVWPTYYYLIKGLSGTDFASVARVGVKETLKVFPWTLPLLLAAFYAGGVRAASEPVNRGMRFVKPLFICAAFAFIPFSYIYLVPIANRYGMPLYLALILATIILQSAILDSRRRLLIFNGLAVVALVSLWAWSHAAYPGNTGDADFMRLAVTIVVGGVIFALSERQAKFRSAKILALALALAISHFQGFAFAKNELPLIQSNMARNRQWQKIWRRIGCATGWSYEHARERIYFVNAHIDEDPRVAYEAAGGVPRNAECGDKIPDGFFVAMNVPSNVNFVDWLLDEPIADEIKQGLRDGDIVLGDSDLGRVAVVPYFVRRTDHLPDHFHDVGLAYEQDPDAAIFDQIPRREGVEKIGENRYLFKWNECPDGHRYCNHGAVVSVEPGNSLKVKILGSALSQVSPWIHPTWTQALDGPYVEVKCGDGQTKSLTMAKSVGFKREYLFWEPVTAYFVANNSLVAPFERIFRAVCKGPIEELSFGRKSSSVDHLRESVNLPANKLSIKLNPN